MTTILSHNEILPRESRVWIIRMYDGVTHVFPVNDLRPHYDEGCACEPQAGGDGFVHNSWDGREKLEEAV